MSVVTLKIHNFNLASDLWGYDGKGQKWEYIYFLDEIKKQAIRYIDLNRIAGYKDNNVIQGFSVVDENKSAEIIEYFDLESNAHLPSATEEDYRNAVLSFDPTKPLDKIANGTFRTEQSFLRKYLFQNRNSCTCSICGEEYPASFMVAAHIKKRAICSEEEKLDFKNIVMPVCKFGCDDLYEKGFISVLQGKVKTINKYVFTPALIEYIKKIEGRDCSYWRDETISYFEWHSTFHTG